MAIGSMQRRDERKSRIAQEFRARDVETVLDLLHLTDMAWHDCYGPHQLEIPPDVLDDVLLLARGDLARPVRLSLAAVQDFRDLRVAADEQRAAAL